MLPELMREWYTVNTIYDDKVYHTCLLCDKGRQIQVKDLRFGKYHPPFFTPNIALDLCDHCIKHRKSKGCCGVEPCRLLFGSVFSI